MLFLNYPMIEQYLIVGIKINTKLQESLDHCIPAYQIYFQEKNPEYLQIFNLDGEQVLGKMLRPGVNMELLADYVKNIKSIIKKVCPQFNVTETEIKVYAHTLIG
jgi:hypothetical protein